MNSSFVICPFSFLLCAWLTTCFCSFVLYGFLFDMLRYPYRVSDVACIKCGGIFPPFFLVSVSKNLVCSIIAPFLSPFITIDQTAYITCPSLGIFPRKGNRSDYFTIDQCHSTSNGICLFSIYIPNSSFVFKVRKIRHIFSLSLQHNTSES